MIKELVIKKLKFIYLYKTFEKHVKKHFPQHFSKGKINLKLF